MPDIVYAQDDRLLAVTAGVAAVTNTRIVVANPTLKKLVNVAFTGSAVNVNIAALDVQAASALLTGKPEKVAANTSYVFAVGIKKLWRTANSSALDTEGFAVSEYTVESEDPRWIAVHNGFVYLPWSVGGVIVYTQHGVLVARYAGLLAETTVAGLDALNGVLYVADANTARAVALTINSDGTLTANDEFALSSCKGVVALAPAEDFMAVACRDRVVIFSTDTPETPTLLGTLRTSYAANHIVNCGINQWWIAADAYIDSQEDRFDYRNSSAVFIANVGVFAISGVSGRMIGEADFIALTPAGVVAGDPTADPDVVTDTFYILTELGDRLVAEDGSPLILEEAP